MQIFLHCHEKMKMITHWAIPHLLQSAWLIIEVNTCRKLIPHNMCMSTDECASGSKEKNNRQKNMNVINQQLSS